MCIMASAVQFVAMAIETIFKIDLSALLYKLGKLCGVFLFQFSIGIFKGLETKSLIKNLNRGRRRRMDRPKFNRRLIRGL